MPRERRVRVGAHQPSAKLSKRQFAVRENAVEIVEIGAANTVGISGNDVLESLSTAAPAVSKKAKQQLKHEAFVDRIKSSSVPYSKAQRRRFNKKQREQLQGGGLGSIEAAISALEKEVISPPADTELDATLSRPPSAKARVGMIGEGKGVTLGIAQRKHVLEMERLRHPLILTNPKYAASPFQTLRTHAQNTLEKRCLPVE